MKPETKFWHEIKKITPKISWTRLENLSAFGTPDLLGYNTNSHFFTVELKVTKSKKIRLSPHQIAFHVKHPNNTFIMVKSLSLNQVKLYEGSRCLELAACGLPLDAYACPITGTLGEGLQACCLLLEGLGSYRRDSLFP